MNYTIEIKQSAKKELAQLPKHIAEKIIRQIRGLANNPKPKGYKKMVGTENAYRIRMGNYRVIYSIFNQQLVIQVIKIGHRKDVYK